VRGFDESLAEVLHLERDGRGGGAQVGQHVPSEEEGLCLSRHESTD
jgi:hypothetical protein